MQISGKRIRSVAKYANHLDRTKDLFVYSPVTNPKRDFKRVGFESAAKMGDTILPKEIGPISTFNSEGRDEPDKTKPMKRRTVGQRIWRRKDWGGHWHEGTVDIVRKCYPRKLTPPPAVEMSVLDVEGKLRLVSKVPANSSDDDLKHAVNLFLEFFQECHLTDDPKSVPIVNPTRVNWRLLPSGGNPWARAKSAVTARITSRSDDSQSIIIDRQEFVCSLDPDDVYVGEGGFTDYLAYVFKAKKLVVLESLTSGNAIYVFDKNWKAFSHLTKREILSQNLQKERIIHATGWKRHLRMAVS